MTYYNNETEVFTMDTLGNRTNVNDRNDADIPYVVDTDTNRYEKVDNLPPSSGEIGYDFAGNMTTDKGGYKYYYDYENRLVKIEDSSSVEVATHDYDALGRRIRVIDKSADPDVTALYYHNPDWQVLAEYDGSNVLQRYFVYGNYIDEALVMNDATDDFYYVQDHLYSTVALIGYVDPAWVVVERCEYDAYGTATIFTDMTDWEDETRTTATASAKGNPYTFTGRRFDVYADGPEPSGHYRHRTYDTYAARFLQYDPMGINPVGGRINRFGVLRQYGDGMSLYEYVQSRPSAKADPWGLFALFYKPKLVCCKRKDGFCDEHFRGFCSCPRGSTMVSYDDCSCRKSAGGRIRDWARDEAYEGSGKDLPTVESSWGNIGPQNAYLHCLGTCKIRQELGWFCAFTAGWGHEVWDNWWKQGVDWYNVQMDLDNNAVGRKCGANCKKSCVDCCMEAHDNGELVYTNIWGELVPTPYNEEDELPPPFDSPIPPIL